MTGTSGRPKIFLKAGCPFCFKVRLFLLEAGLVDKVELIQGSTSEEEQTLRNELAHHVLKVSFPIARFGDDDYLVGSDEIIDRLAESAAISITDLPTLKAYVDGPFSQLITLYRENAELKGRTA
jgi:glutathione S-transferase